MQCLRAQKEIHVSDIRMPAYRKKVRLVVSNSGYEIGFV